MNEGAMLLRLVEFAMAVLVVEALVLVWLGRGRGASHALPARSVMLIALSGLGLLAALRLGLADAPAGYVVAGLSVGGVAHAADLATRLRRPDTGDAAQKR